PEQVLFCKGSALSIENLPLLKGASLFYSRFRGARHRFARRCVGQIHFISSGLTDQPRMALAMRQFVLLTAVSSIVFLTNLGVPQLWDEDEPIFAGAAQEMLERGEWIVPYFNGQMLPDKPVLTYWVMLAAYKTLGVNEWAARLGSALFAFGGVLLVWRLGRKLFSPAVGVWAGVILATSLGFDVVARAATPDTLLSFFSTLAMLAFACGATPPSGAPLSRMPGWPTFAASYAAMGFAVLAKGPIGCLLPTATTGLFLLIAKAPRPAGETQAGAV